MDIKNITNFEDDFECACGNTVDEEGFFPCDLDGNEVEPDESWEDNYICSKCNQIYHVKKSLSI